jgi:hypothetical protein
MRGNLGRATRLTPAKAFLFRRDRTDQDSEHDIEFPGFVKGEYICWVRYCYLTKVEFSLSMELDCSTCDCYMIQVGYVMKGKPWEICNQAFVGLHFKTPGSDPRRDGTEIPQACTGWHQNSAPEHDHEKCSTAVYIRLVSNEYDCDRVNIRYFSVLTNQYDLMVIGLTSCLNILPPNIHRICDPHLCCIRGTAQMVEALCYKPEGRGFEPLWSHWILLFQYTQSFRPHHGPGVYSVPNRNEYQKTFLGAKGDRRVRQTTYLPSESRLSRKCRIVDISQTYRPPRPVTGIALLYFICAA